MKAVKANKEYNITESEKASYLAQGYDICDNEGNVTERSPLSTVPYSDYEAVLKENEELKAKLASDKKGSKKEKGESDVPES